MKKYILSLFVWLFWLISFCNATIYSVETDPLNCVNWDVTYDLLWLPTFLTIKDLGDWWNYRLCFSCENNVSWSCWSVSLQWWRTFSFLSSSSSVWCNWLGLSRVVVSCKTNWDDFSLFYTWAIAPCSSNCPECPTCPEVNTWEILSWYILQSEIDTNYCVWNWLCPSEVWTWDWEDFSWDLQYSNLYINNILHPWKQNIFVDIPDYITRDYNSTWDDFNLYVGSWYDVEYIESIININSYRPSSEDFTNIFVSWLTLVFPYIFVLLLIVFIWKLLKRIFK